MRREKLAEAIRKVFADLRRDPGPVVIERVYCGHWQRAAGSFLWVAKNAEGRHLFASCDPAHEVVKAHREGRAGLYNNGFDIEIMVESAAPVVTQARRERQK